MEEPAMLSDQGQLVGVAWVDQIILPWDELLVQNAIGQAVARQGGQVVFGGPGDEILLALGGEAGIDS